MDDNRAECVGCWVIVLAAVGALLFLEITADIQKQKLMDRVKHLEDRAKELESPASSAEPE